MLSKVEPGGVQMWWCWPWSWWWMSPMRGYWLYSSSTVVHVLDVLVWFEVALVVVTTQILSPPVSRKQILCPVTNKHAKNKTEQANKMRTNCMLIQKKWGKKAKTLNKKGCAFYLIHPCTILYMSGKTHHPLILQNPSTLLHILKTALDWAGSRDRSHSKDVLWTEMLTPFCHSQIPSGSLQIRRA